MKRKHFALGIFGLASALGIVMFQNFTQAFVAVYTPTQFYHQTGFADTGGWAVNTQSAAGAMIYGPYVTNMPAQKLIANFVMLVDNNTADVLPIATVDVFDADANVIVASKTLYRSEMATPYTDGNFSVSFDWTNRSGHRIEFRVWPTRNSYLRVEGVSVQADVGSAAVSGIPTVYSLSSTYASENSFGHPASHASDSSALTYYSSNTFSGSTNTRNVQYAGWTTNRQLVSQIQLTARKVGGTIVGFPQTYWIYVGNPAGNAWQYLGYFSAQPDPTTGIATVDLGGYYMTNGIVIQPDDLGQDSGSYVFQLTEVKLTNDAPAAGAYNTLVLKGGQSIPFDKYTLALQTDGNLVMYSNLWRPAQIVVFNTNSFTDCTSGCKAVFQSDGNFVLYKNGVSYWSSGTYGNTGAKLRLLRKFPYVAIVDSAGTTIWPFLDPNRTLPTSSTEKLVYQQDGNLAQYMFLHPQDPYVLNSTQTWGKSCSTNCRAYLNLDGSVRLTQNGITYWSGPRPAHTVAPAIYIVR